MCFSCRLQPTMRTIATIVSKGVLKRCIPDSIPVRYIGNKSGGRVCSELIEPHSVAHRDAMLVFGVMLGEPDGIRVRGMLRSGSAGRGEGQDDKQGRELRDEGESGAALSSCEPRRQARTWLAHTPVVRFRQTVSWFTIGSAGRRVIRRRSFQTLAPTARGSPSRGKPQAGSRTAAFGSPTVSSHRAPKRSD